MTRRLALAILLIVWATLIAGGIVAYFATRSVRLADLDAAVISRARSLPEVAGTNEAAARMEEAAGDRYFISNELSRTQGSFAPASTGGPLPVVVLAAMGDVNDGQHIRTLTLRFTSRSDGKPLTVVYSASADRFNGILRRLAMALVVFGAAAGIAAAWVAIAVSRTALRPLRGTADAIGSINERQLDRRIDASALPEELRPVADRLNDMLARLEQAFAQRKQFLADASHELRTPVAALVTTLEVALRRPRDAAELTRVLNSCLSDARMLRQLVQTLLHHARGEAVAMQERPEVFDAAALFNQCADIADGLALAKNVTVRRNVPVPLGIRSQPQRLRGIVVNLLGNAIEYNRPGGEVELKVEVDGADLEISVADTGRGIAAENLPHIFQPFYRVDGAGRGESQDDSHHLGLGLYLVDSHIKALGGQCRIQSELGVGTTIYVRLPGVIASEPVVLEGAAV